MKYLLKDIYETGHFNAYATKATIKQQNENIKDAIVLGVISAVTYVAIIYLRTLKEKSKKMNKGEKF